MKSRSTKMGTFTVEHGSEGPRHDPYGFTQITFEPKNPAAPRVVLHYGLGEWMRIGSERVVDKFSVLVTEFKTHTGMEPHEVERLMERPVYDPLRGVKLNLELTVNDIRWIIRGLNYASTKNKSRLFRAVIDRVRFKIGKAACDAFGDHIMMQNDASIGPDSGSESFHCDACGWSFDVTYY